MTAEQIGDRYGEVMASLEGIIDAVEDVMGSITEETTLDDLMEAMTHVEEALKNGRSDVSGEPFNPHPEFPIEPLCCSYHYPVEVKD